jgi:hypothetical protein
MPVKSKILASHGSIGRLGSLSSLSCNRITSAILVSIQGFETDELGSISSCRLSAGALPEASKGREQSRLSPFFSRREML